MHHSLETIQEKLASRHHIFTVFKNQVNKDLQRSGMSIVDATAPADFLEELLTLLNTAIKTSDPNLQQLYYLADVQERHLENGIAAGFIVREWIKIQFRLRQ